MNWDQKFKKAKRTVRIKPWVFKTDQKDILRFARKHGFAFVQTPFDYVYKRNP